MNYLVFLLLMLVIIDHALKYHSESLIFYKNNHLYSVIVVLLEEPPHFDELVSLAKNTEHEWIFVNVNDCVDSKLYEELTILDTQIDRSKYITTPHVLSQAYMEGYARSSHEYFLFMNSALRFNEPKFITHMANNLVEHQVYTIKEVLPFRSTKEGYKLFFDLFDDMETTADKININFFSIKRITFELCGGHEEPFENSHDFHKKLLNKNVNILYINHNNAVKRVEKHKGFKGYTKHWITLYSHKSFHGGIQKMVMLLLAFHLFYLFMIVNFTFVNIIFLLLAHLAFNLIISRRANHSFLAYLLVPFYMLLFDGVLVIAQFKRLVFRKKHCKKSK